MSGLRAPGPIPIPIVGHATATSCQVWIRVGDPSDQGSKLDAERRALGIITVVGRAGARIPARQVSPHYFRLRREFDRTGMFELGVDFARAMADGKRPPLSL